MAKVAMLTQEMRLRMIANLPQPTARFVPRRKEDLMVAIENDIISMEEASKTYNLSMEELKIWQDNYRKGGRQALRATHVNDYR